MCSHTQRFSVKLLIAFVYFMVGFQSVAFSESAPSPRASDSALPSTPDQAPSTSPEVQSSKVAELTEATNLLLEPYEGAQVLGRLPPGTVVTMSGTLHEGYTFIDVELEKDKTSGWVKTSLLKPVSFAPLERRRKPLRPSLPNGKTELPSDEGVVLWRQEKEMFYGLLLGGNLGITTTPYNANIYVDPGMLLGAEVCWFLNSNTALGAIGYYQLINGTSSADNLNLSFGFANIGAIAHYYMGKWGVFGSLQYGFGLSALDIPMGVSVPTISSLSSFWVNIGGTYEMPVSSLVSLELRLGYGISIMEVPFLFQAITLGGAIFFGG